MNTTDDQNELFDIVDESDNVIRQATRREVHANKDLIHRSIGVLVFNSQGELLLQQRSSTKDTDPLKWTISASGHVNSNLKSQISKLKTKNQKAKIYEETARRELKEELGIEVEMKPLFKYLCLAPHETEMQFVYKAFSDGPFRYHPQEIIQGKFFTQKKLAEAIRNGEIELSYMGRMVLEKLDWLSPLDKKE